MAIKELKQSNYEWIDLHNPDAKELEKIANKYSLNYYTLTDSLEPNHLPKFENQDTINFFIVRLVHENLKRKTNIESLTNKIAVFYNDHLLITIHRIEIPFLEEIIEKYIKTEKIYTVNSIVIKIIWNTLYTYNTSILKILSKVENLENKVFLKSPDSSSNILQNMYLLKRKVNICMKLLILTDEVINSVKPTKQEKPAHQDVKDLQVKLSTLYEQVIEDINNLLNLYISLASLKSNDIMKTLTIFSIFFMPLTFIAGIYGMNFKYMPELEKAWGYPVILIIMLIITLIIYYWLKRKKWL
ncbi:CorA family divalent cation transporter [Apibacter adventoris]|uniref:CorA family divalent cation transporter n=1 Tax=Apibacter adventoris TaxID=1679466 RepID=UPI000CF62DD8|nr:CorA family divalent cation transporter [Apibacter adventoris]PQL92451.1 hypothetical protein C4S76_10250 [Apibacter adventoris]